MSNFTVDYPSFDTLVNSIRLNSQNWGDALEALSDKIDELISSDRFTGRGADSSKEYMRAIHVPLIQTLFLTIDTFANNALVYKTDYFRTIDSDTCALIKEKELDTIVDNNKRQRDSAARIDDEIQNAISSVSDIFRTSRPDLGQAYSKHNDLSKFIDDLITRINELERRHTAQDFKAVENMISQSNALITECLSKPKSFKRNFSAAGLAGISSFAGFVDAYNNLFQENQSNQQKYAEAGKAEEKHVKTLEQERKERERVGTVIKWTVGALAIAASVAVTVATGGAAAPLILGAVGAATSIATTATNKLVDEWVDYGDMKRMDWKSFGVDVAVAGGTGFISGFAGGAIGKGLKGVGFVSKGLSSTNMLTRAGTAGFVGTVKSVSVGLATRTVTEAGEAVKKGKFDLGESAGKVFNVKEIGKDAAGGFVSSSVGETVDILSEKTHIDHKVLNNNNQATRIGGSAIYGGTQEVAKGTAKRFTQEMIDSGGDLGKSAGEAFDLKEIGNDFAGGAADKAANAYVDKPIGHKIKSEEFKSSKVRESMPKNAPNYRTWLDNGGSIYRDSEGTITYENANGNTLTFDEHGKANYDRAREAGANRGLKDYQSNQKWRANYNAKNRTDVKK